MAEQTPLDPEVKKAIEEKIEKGLIDPRSLTKEDRAFLRARSAYISRRDKEVLDPIIKETKEERKEREALEKGAETEKEKAEGQSQKDQNAHLNPQDDDGKENLG